LYKSRQLSPTFCSFRCQLLRTSLREWSTLGGPLVTPLVAGGISQLGLRTVECPLTLYRGATPRPFRTAPTAPRSKLTRGQLGFRGGLVFKAHILLYHSTLGLRVIKKKKKFPNHSKTCRESLLRPGAGGWGAAGRGWGVRYAQTQP